MPNEYFDWPSRAASDRFVRFDVVRSADMNDALDDLSNGLAKLPTPAQLWAQRQNYAVATGAANAWSVTIGAAHLTDMVDGMMVRVNFPASNTSTTPTLNLNGRGAKRIVAYNTAGIEAAYIEAGISETLIYNATTDCWHLMKAPNSAASSGVSHGGSTVLDYLNALNLANFAALRAYDGEAKQVRITGYLATAAPQGYAGTFVRNDVDTASADNNGTIIVDALGRRWNRVFLGEVNTKWFGAIGDGSAHPLSDYYATLAEAQAHYPHAVALTDEIDWAATQAAIALIEKRTDQTGGAIYMPYGNYRMGRGLTCLGAQIYMRGETPCTEYGALANEATTRLVWINTNDSELTYMLNIGDTSGSTVTRRVCLENFSLDGQGYVSGIKSTWAPEMLLSGMSFNELYRGHFCASSGGFGRAYSNTWDSCYFHNFKTFAIRIDEDGHRTNIVRCHFTSNGGVYVPTNCLQFGSVGYCSVVNIIGCNFEPFGDAATGAGLHWIDAQQVRNLNVICNYFEVPAGSTVSSCVRLGSVGQNYGFTCHGNRFLIATDAPDYASGKSPIWVERCYGGSIAGNYFQGWNAEACKITGSAGNIRDLWYHGNYGDAITAPFTPGFESRVYAWDFSKNTDIRDNFRLGHTAASTTVVQALTAGDNMQVLNALGAGAEIVSGAATAASSNAAWRPLGDNLQRLGTSVRRWSEVFAGTGTINTSDAREKTDPEDIPDVWLDAWEEVQFVRFKWKDSVARKGDDARWHVGVIAQQVKAAFESHGIDPFSIGVLCYDEWDDEYTEIVTEGEDGEVTREVRLTTPAGNRYGVRYDQAMALESALQRRKIEELRARIESAAA